MTNLIKSIMQFLGRLLKWEPVQDFTDLPYMPPTPPVEPVIPPVEAPKQPVVATLLWDTPQHCFHSVRVICDREGLTLEQKNELCATIYGESEFNNNAVCKNKNAQGIVTSIDVGICQWNSYWHCGEGKTFPSTTYVVENPDKAVKKMVQFYKNGQINLWVAHKSGRYLQFLKPNSPMWKLKQT